MKTFGAKSDDKIYDFAGGIRSCHHNNLWYYQGWKFDIMTICGLHNDDLVQDCSNSSANALELQQSCTKPLMCLLCLGLYIHQQHEKVKICVKKSWDLSSPQTCLPDKMVHSVCKFETTNNKQFDEQSGQNWSSTQFCWLDVNKVCAGWKHTLSWGNIGRCMTRKCEIIWKCVKKYFLCCTGSGILYIKQNVLIVELSSSCVNIGTDFSLHHVIFKTLTHWGCHSDFHQNCYS